MKLVNIKKPLYINCGYRTIRANAIAVSSPMVDSRACLPRACLTVEVCIAYCLNHKEVFEAVVDPKVVIDIRRDQIVSTQDVSEIDDRFSVGLG